VVDETGHDTIMDNYIENVVVVFGYRLNSPDIPEPFTISSQQIFSLKRIVNAVNDFKDTGDYAILELNEVPPYPSVNLHFEVPKENDKVYTIGHPVGLPQKITGLSVIKAIKNKVFIASIDAFSGNSGSPVLFEDNKVIGILVRGQRDWKVQGDEIYGLKVGEYNVPYVIPPSIQAKKTVGESCFMLTTIQAHLHPLM